MRNTKYWKSHYVVVCNADEIETKIKMTTFLSDSHKNEMVYFENKKNADNILVSQGSGGHEYIFVELAYLMYLRGYNVFVMPKHGGATINQLVSRHADAIDYISKTFNDKIAVFAEGLECYAVFYMALAGAPVRSIACLNGPAILTEYKFQQSMFGGGEGAAGRRKNLLPIISVLSKAFPWIKIRISTYLDFRELIDTSEENRRVEQHFVYSFDYDPDVDTHYPLSAVMSLVNTPPPKPLSELKIPTMFIVPTRGFYPDYFKDLFSRLPNIRKDMVEVDGSVFWMLSHPTDAAKIVCDWFDKTD